MKGHDHDHDHEHVHDVAKAKEVGRMSEEAMLFAKRQIRPGRRLLDVANEAEQFLRSKGYGLAFPINLSVNDQAAHYTPSVNDEKVFGDNDLIKIDFGAERDGVLGDGAVTLDLSGNNGKLVEAANAALDDAISTVRAGVKVNEIGAVIAKAITARGFKPIMNLGGHAVEEHDLHASTFIPNYDSGDETELEEGMMVAIEPFATDGKGMVVDSEIFEIYSFAGPAQVRSSEARLVLQEISGRYSTEPFAVRWLTSVVPDRFRLYSAIRELMRAGAVEPHPTLVEQGHGLVSQAEAELIVTKDSCEIITRVTEG